MGLTSTGLLVLLITLAVGLMATIVWYWPKFAGKGVRALATRAGLFVAGQLTLVLVLLVVVNNYYIFYASWSDLLGTDHRAVSVRNNGAATAVRPAARPDRPMARQVVQLGKDGKKGGGQADPAKDGRLERVTIQGTRTGLSTEAYVYRPPQYFQRAYKATRFPVMYDFTGYPGDARQLIDRLHVPTALDRGITAGRVQPMIIVMIQPSPKSVMPRDTECTDVPSGPQVVTFYTQDVPDALRATYHRVAAGARGWGALGDSTGGYCAVKLAMLASDRFTAAVSMAGYFYPQRDGTTGDLYGGSRLVEQDNSLIWRLQHLPPPPVSVLITTSRVGERDYGEAKRFLSLARPPMTTQQVLVPQGGHNPRTWRRVLPSALEWMSAHLRAEGPPPKPAKAPKSPKSPKDSKSPAPHDAATPAEHAKRPGEGKG